MFVPMNSSKAPVLVLMSLMLPAESRYRCSLLGQSDGRPGKRHFRSKDVSSAVRGVFLRLKLRLKLFSWRQRERASDTVGDSALYIRPWEHARCKRQNAKSPCAELSFEQNGRKPISLATVKQAASSFYEQAHDNTAILASKKKYKHYTLPRADLAADQWPTHPMGSRWRSCKFPRRRVVVTAAGLTPAPGAQKDH